MDLAPHQQRVVDEKSALDVKIDALAKFIDTSAIYKDLHVDEKSDLDDQLDVMRDYSAILGRRIKRFSE
jgi:hypothetical protein